MSMAQWLISVHVSMALAQWLISVHGPVADTLYVDTVQIGQQCGPGYDGDCCGAGRRWRCLIWPMQLLWKLIWSLDI